jgi:hypothetical protein
MLLDLQKNVKYLNSTFWQNGGYTISKRTVLKSSYLIFDFILDVTNWRIFKA